MIQIYIGTFPIPITKTIDNGILCFKGDILRVCELFRKHCSINRQTAFCTHVVLPWHIVDPFIEVLFRKNIKGRNGF